MPAASDAPRLFVALFPSLPGREALVDLMDGVSRARWTAPDDLHLTLRFIGPVDEAQEAAIAESLESVRVHPFLLHLEGSGVFPPRGQPSVLWAGVGRGHPLLYQLRQQVDDRLLAVAPALALRPFVPHLTVGRVRDCSPESVAHWLKRHRDFTGPVWPVDAFALMASEPRPGGARYRTLRRYPLAEREDSLPASESSVRRST